MSELLEQYRQLADRVRDIMLFVRPDGTLAAANRAAVDAYGYSASELLALRIFDLRESGDSAVAVQLAQAVAGSVKFETLHRRKDGSLFPVEVNAQAADIDGEPLVVSVIRDVSERRLAEQALRESEERFRTIANAAPALIWLADDRNRCTWFNRPWLDFTGRAVEEELGTGWMSGIHPEDLARYVAADAAAFERRAPVEQEYRLRRHDGEYRWLLERGVPQYGPDGRFSGYVGSCVDITGRKRADEAFRASQAWLGLALQGARAGVWQWDLVSGEVNWSPELFELLGLDPETTRASTEVFIECIHPDDRAAAVEAFRAAAARGGRFESEFRAVRRADGVTIWLSSAGRVDRDESGRPVRAWGINQDISIGKATEEQLRLALAASQAGVWSWEVASDRTRWSPENYLLYGFDPARGAPSYAEWLSHIHPDDTGRVTQAVGDALSGRIPEYRVEFRVVHPQRGVRWLIGLGRVDRAADGTAVRMDGINLDVTDRRETEARLQQAQRVQSVGRLAGGIAHEVNNLMTAVLGFGAFAVGHLEPGHPALPEVEQMVKAGERAAAITRQLLAFTRQQVLRPARLDVNVVVREMTPVLERILGAGHPLVLRLDSGLGEVQADRGQLEQVLLNLALNSRDALAGGGTVTIGTEAAELDLEATRRHPGIELRRGRYLLLSVSDTGAGMDETTRARVFEPFFTTKPVGHGTGLGLSTVYGIVKQSGGYVWLYSEPGLGTVVKLYLPMIEAGTAPPEPAAIIGQVPRARGEVVLIAEDEEMVRSLARRTLEMHGYRVVEAADGRAALELLERLEGGVDLVLSDAVMPELSGRALGELIGARWPGIPVIYMSGYPGTEVVDRGLVIPDAPFVAKPFTPEALARRAREVLDAARGRPGPDPARSR
jgi:PAS domain S-box-containing protein